MKTAAGRVVFDSSAVLAFLLLEPGAARVKAELRACQARTSEGWIAPVTLAEIHRRLRRSLDASAARRAIDHLLLTPLAPAEMDRELATVAAEWSFETGVGLFDTLVAATAARLAARVLTADPDFRRLGGRVETTFIR